jgi:hypothetical protein
MERRFFRQLPIQIPSLGSGNWFRPAVYGFIALISTNVIIFDDMDRMSDRLTDVYRDLGRDPFAQIPSFDFIVGMFMFES